MFLFDFNSFSHTRDMERKHTSQDCCLFGMIKKAFCINGSSPDTGKGKSKFKSSSMTKKVCHGFHLVKGQSGHDMEDYHVAEYRKKKGHVLGLFAIFDGHLGDRVPSYLKDNLFDNILEEVFYFIFFSIPYLHIWLIDLSCHNLNKFRFTVFEASILGGY